MVTKKISRFFVVLYHNRNSYTNIINILSTKRRNLFSVLLRDLFL